MLTNWESLAEPIPGYRLVERLGRGGFGEVWKAEVPGGLFKAIKFVHGAITSLGESLHSQSADTGDHAGQELKALARVRGVRHPFILSVERYEVIHDQLVIVMELADQNLDDRFQECKKQGLPGISRDELLRYMSDAAEALDMMSAKHDLQHLDIKPQNLFVVGNHVKVGDFGLVKDLEGYTANVTGGVTPIYAAPETFDGWVSRFSDQYSLAVVYQEMLTGARPFPAKSARQVMMQHLTMEPDVSGLPEHDREIVKRALAKDPNHRYPTCTEFVEALRTATRRSFHPGYPPASSESMSQSRLLDKSMGAADVSTILNVRGNRQHSGESTAVRSAPIMRHGQSHQELEGTLCPTLIIGLGGTGIRVAERLRNLIGARHGDPRDWPPIRILDIDCDDLVLEHLSETENCRQEAHDQLVACRFQKITQYIKRWEEWKYLSSWLSLHMIHQIPTNGTTRGYRAIGRLAFIENHKRILSRIRAEIKTLIDPDYLNGRVAGTGLGLRRQAPRIQIVSGMAGGTGSGMFIDLAYTARRVLEELGESTPDVQGILFSGDFRQDDKSELARTNQFALAQDLVDVSQSNKQFVTEYGPGDREVYVGPPLQSVYFFDTTATCLPEPKVEAAVDQAIEFLYSSAVATIGRRMDQDESIKQWPMFRGVGWFSLLYPAKELCLHAAQRLGMDIVKSWMTHLNSQMSGRYARAAQDTLFKWKFDADPLIEQLINEVNQQIGSSIHVFASSKVADLAEVLRLQDTPDFTLGQQALMEIRQWIGPDPCTNERDASDEEPRFLVALREAGDNLTTQLLAKLTQHLHQALEEPGPRFDIQRRIAQGFSLSLSKLYDDGKKKLESLRPKLERNYLDINQRISAPQKGPESIRKLTDAIEDYSSTVIYYRLTEKITESYLVLRGKLSDWSRTLVSTRQSIEILHDQLAKDFEDMLRPIGGFCSQPLFPSGMLSMADAVEDLVRMVSNVRMEELEFLLQDNVISPLGGLVKIGCGTLRDFDEFKRQFVQTICNYVSDLAPTADVSDTFAQRHANDSSSMLGELRAFHEWATPTMGLYPNRVPSQQMVPAIEVLYIGMPETPSGKQIFETVKQAFHSSVVINVASEQANFCRFLAHPYLACVLSPAVLSGSQLYKAGCQSRFSPRIFPE